MILTSLGNGDEVMAHVNSRERELLDGSGGTKSSQLDVLQHDGVKTSSLKRLDRDNALLTLLLDLNLLNAKALLAMSSQFHLN